MTHAHGVRATARTAIRPHIGLARGVALTLALAGGAHAAPALQGTIALPDVLAAALDGAPQLAAYAAEMRAREARTLQAGLPPNPDLRLEAEDLGGGGKRRAFEQAEYTLTVGQLVELGGKRARRRRAAALDRTLAGWDWETARLDALTLAAKAFHATVAAQERVALTGQLVALAREAARGVEAQLQAGGASPVEALQARVAVAAAEGQALAADNELAAARAVLASTWGERAARFAAVRGSLAPGPRPPALETFLATVDANPDVARWQAELEAREAGVAVERARAIPDVTVGLGGRHFADDGSNALVLGLSVPLPVFDRNQGGIREAEARVAKAAGERTAVTIATHAALARAYADLLTTWEQSALLRERMIPDAERAYARAQDAYRQGLFRFLEVLDTQRTLFELREQDLRTRTAHALTLADVERLGGMSPRDVAPGGSR